MARRRSKSKKIQPAVRKMFFSVPLANDEGNFTTNYIDLSQCASIVNRRFYRQGLNWAVAGFRIHSNSTTGTVNIFKIQDTWMASNAWAKSFALWNKMNSQVLEDAPSVKPKYHDFKICMDVDHVGKITGAGNFNNLIPYNEDQNGVQKDYSQGEWTRSLYEFPNYGGTPGNTQARTPRMHGPQDQGVSIGLIEGYAQSRSVPFSPDPETQDPATGWMNQLFDDGDRFEDIMINLQDIGDQLPYDQDLYPGGVTNAPDPELHGIGIISGTTIGGMTAIEGGTFQCGLIKVTNNCESTSALSVDLEVILVPGDHRGYMCESMLEV